MRSIPEKTLEHWAGIYLANRFPGSSLWWPARGEDTRITLPRLAAMGPGETLALELKTTTVAAGWHTVVIDVRQLKRYLHSRPPVPVYYVFPIPFWDIPLGPGDHVPVPPPDGPDSSPPAWWRRAAGSPWFATWFYVLPARTVAALLPSGWRSMTRATLFGTWSLDPRASPPWHHLLRVPGYRPIPWLEFWRRVERRRVRQRQPPGFHDTVPGGTVWRTISSSVLAAREELRLSVVDEQWDTGGELSFADVEGEMRESSGRRRSRGAGRAVVHIPEAPPT